MLIRNKLRHVVQNSYKCLRNDARRNEKVQIARVTDFFLSHVFVLHGTRIVSQFCPPKTLLTYYSAVPVHVSIRTTPSNISKKKLHNTMSGHGTERSSGNGVLGSFVNLASLVRGTVTDAMDGVREQGRYRQLLELVQAIIPSVSFVSHSSWTCPMLISQWVQQNRYEWGQIECVDTDLYLRLRMTTIHDFNSQDIRPNPPQHRTILIVQHGTLQPLALWSVGGPHVQTSASGELVNLPSADLVTEDQVPIELTMLRRRNQLLSQLLSAVHMLHVVYLPRIAQLLFHESSVSASAVLSDNHPWSEMLHSFHRHSTVWETSYGTVCPPVSVLSHFRSTSLMDDTKTLPTARHLLLPLVCRLPGMSICSSAQRAADRSHVHGHRPKGVVSNEYFSIGLEQHKICWDFVLCLFQKSKLTTQHEIELMRWCDRMITTLGLHFAPPLQFPALNLLADMLFVWIQIHVGPWFQAFDSRAFHPFELTWPSIRFWNQSQASAMSRVVATPACIPPRPLQRSLAYWSERYASVSSTWTETLLKDTLSIRDSHSHLDIQEVQGIDVSDLLQ